MPELAKLVGDADLAVRRPVQRELDDDRFDLGRRAVLQDRLAPRQLLPAPIPRRRRIAP